MCIEREDEKVEKNIFKRITLFLLHTALIITNVYINFNVY